MPIFQQGGWFDPYSGSHLRSFAAIGDRVPNRVMIGPWSHEEEIETFRGDIDLSAVADRDPRPRARLLRPLPQGRGQRLGGAAAARSCSCSAPNEWRGESEWPLAGHRVHAVAPAQRRRSSSPDPPRADEPADRYDYDPEDPVPTIGGVNSVLTMTQGAADADPARPARPASRSRRRDDVLVYTSEQLDHDLEVIGPVEMVLFAASSAQRHRLHRARSATSTRTASSIFLTEGILRARYRNSNEGDIDRAARAGRGRRVPDPLLPDGERFRQGPPAPPRRDELELPALLAQPEHRRGRRHRARGWRSRARPCCTRRLSLARACCPSSTR